MWLSELQLKTEKWAKKKALVTSLVQKVSNPLKEFTRRCNVPERKHEPPSDLIPLGREGHANVDRYNLLRTPVRSVRRLDVQIRPQSPEGVQNGNNSDIQGDSPWTEDEYPGLRTAISMRVLDSSKQLFDTSDPSAVQNRPSRTCLEVVLNLHVARVSPDSDVEE
ncbi:unnamed protein product [Toxocara canis]|uniref:Uncharacterized protein n=1 Tax=Toxocara canis TaxID=6265 RepID=A0A183TVW4_TOXCA|nr:unnamed protein product [Toxocara canis]